MKGAPPLSGLFDTRKREISDLGDGEGFGVGGGDLFEKGRKRASRCVNDGVFGTVWVALIVVISVL